MFTHGREPSEVTPPSPPLWFKCENCRVSVPDRGCEPPNVDGGGNTTNQIPRMDFWTCREAWRITVHLSFKYWSSKLKYIQPRSKSSGFYRPILNLYCQNVGRIKYFLRCGVLRYWTVIPTGSRSMYPNISSAQCWPVLNSIRRGNHSSVCARSYCKMYVCHHTYYMSIK